MDANCFKSLIPDYILKLKPYVAGKAIKDVQRELGLDEIVKLASNENSLGPAPKALEAMLRYMTELHRYPDVIGLELCQALAERFNVTVDNVILGSGSESILSYIMRTFLHTDDEVLSVTGTFVGFKVMASARQTPPVLVPLNNYRFDLNCLAEHITERTKIVYLCNPNNPTGTYFTKQELDAFLAKLPDRVLVILDEAYFEFAKDAPDFPDSMWYRHDQVITLRTFSKAYGLAGLRIGYGLAHDYLIQNLRKIKLPFEPSILAQAAGVGALADTEFLHRTLEMNNTGREYFYRELRRLGIEYLPTAANFILCPMASAEQVVRLNELLLHRGVIIRPLGAFDLPHCIRITIGTMEENRKCIAALEEILPQL